VSTRYAHVTVAGNPEDAVKHGLTVKAKCGLTFVPRAVGRDVDQFPECEPCHSRIPTRVADVPHFVYRCYTAAGELIYVGCSVAPIQRMDQHRANAWWFDQVARVRYVVYPNKDYALYKEREAIGEENPRWNIKGRDQSRFDLADFRDLHCAMAQNGASGKRLEAVRAKALLQFGDDITEPFEVAS
jgi:hypothetical protein